MMNFSPFGTNFPTSIPNIHQFAAKFSQENLGSSSNQDANLRYSSNGIASFVQQNHGQQSGLGGTIKYTNYANEQSNIYLQQNIRNEKNKETFEQQELSQELCAAVLQNEEKISIQRQVKQENRTVNQHNQNLNVTSALPVSTWQSLTAPVADYLSHLPASTLPLSLHHFLKYSAENIKKETTQQQFQNHDNQIHLQTTSMNHLNNLNDNSSTINTAHFPAVNAVIVKKKKKKKITIEKEKKPRPKPGEIRLTTALDGSTLYCCPECHMAYPEKELLEQHLLGHTLERRFVCDICGAGLKRKDHLTRHKQSHNPERPYVCTVCLKAFKRKEQLTLHFVIHSGEKRHVCSECGKGFYRKDHLRKHTRSHIARRVKAELSQHGSIVSSTLVQNHGINS